MRRARPTTPHSRLPRSGARPRSPARSPSAYQKGPSSQSLPSTPPRSTSPRWASSAHTQRRPGRLLPSTVASRADEAVDVSALIDEGPFSGFQKRLIFGTALLIILDGVDNQLLPNAIPAMMREWNLPRAAFADASAAAPFGMMLGSVFGGMVGDRVGRRAALIGCVLTFAVLTLMVAAVGSLGALTVVRFLAGMGLGGAMPNAAALASEYAPRRQRPLAVTMTIVCIPLGGFLAGVAAGQVVPTLGWRALFVIGGAIPIVIALVSIKTLGESPRF